MKISNRQWFKLTVSDQVGRLLYRGTRQKDVLYAFYDLAVSPASFDVTTFLAYADFFRRKKGCRRLHVVVVPGPYEGFKKAGSKEQNDQGTENLRWRVRNIVMPCCWLVPSCREVTVCATREEAGAIRQTLVLHVYPKGYAVEMPRKRRHAAIHLVKAVSKGAVLPSFEATPLGLFHVRNWIRQNAGGRKVVTISLRESSYRPLRNSNLSAWALFAKSLDPSVYCPVFLRDTETAMETLPKEIEEFSVFLEASWNIELRAALYEIAFLNLLVNNGPIGLCIYSRRVRYLMFKVLTPAYRSTSEEYFTTRVGIPIGGQWPAATPFQRFVWEEDRVEVIQKAFQEMCDKIESEKYAVHGPQTT